LIAISRNGKLPTSKSHDVYRFTLQRQREHTAENARSIKFTKFLNTRPARLQLLLREREDMMLSREVMVARPNPSSERRPRPPRRLPSSLNAVPAREED
jgi:hypothetical protein